MSRVWRGGLRLQVFVEPGEGTVVGALGVGAFESVTGAADGFQFRRHAGGDQALDDPQRLLVCDVGIGSAVNRENGRRVGGDPVERTGAHVGEALVVEIAAEKLRQDFGGVHRFGIGLREVRGSVFVDHALHGAGLVSIRAGAFELFDARGEAEHQHEVTAGAAAQGADMAGVDLVFRRVGAEKSNRGLDVLYGSRKLIARREPVVGGGGDIAVLGQFDGQPNVAFLRTRAETSAMHQQDRGTRGVGGVARADDVHGLPAADGRILHLAFGENGVRDFGALAGWANRAAGTPAAESGDVYASTRLYSYRRTGVKGRIQSCEGKSGMVKLTWLAAFTVLGMFAQGPGRGIPGLTEAQATSLTNMTGDLAPLTEAWPPPARH